MQKLKRKPLLMRLDATLSRLPVIRRLRGLLLGLSANYQMLIAWILLLVLTCLILSGCTPRPAVKPILPPQASARVIPVFDGKTYRDVLLWSIDLREGFQNCEYDKAAWRELYKEPKK